MADAQCFTRLNGINIEYLDLSRCMFGDAELALICRAVFPALKFLRMDNNRISAMGIDSIAHSGFANVMFLHLCGNLLGNEGVQELARSHFPNLVDLRLSTLFANSDQNKISQVDGLDHVNFPKMQYLYLSQNNLADDAMGTLAKSNWPDLFVIMLCTCGMMLSLQHA